METFDRFMKDAFPIYYKEKKEATKVDLLQTIRNLISTYYTQQLSSITDPKDQHAVSSK